MHTDQMHLDPTISALSEQLGRMHLTPPPRAASEKAPDDGVKDLKGLVAHGLTDDQGALLSPKELPLVLITDEMKAAVEALLALPLHIDAQSTTLEMLISMTTNFLFDHNLLVPSCLLVDEEIYKILGYDYLEKKFLHVVNDKSGTITTYLSNELLARFKREAKTPLDTLTVRFSLPDAMPDEIRHQLLTQLYSQFSAAFGPKIITPFEINDQNHLSGFAIVSSELRLHIAFCTNLQIHCFSTLSAQQIELQRQGDKSYKMRVVDHKIGAQSTVDIIFKLLRLIPSTSTHQSHLLLRLVRRDFLCLGTALRAFEAELFGQLHSVVRLLEFYDKEGRKHSSDEDRIRDLFLIAQIGTSLGYESIVNQFVAQSVARALPKPEAQTKSFWAANAALLNTLTFSEWLSLIKLFSPLLHESPALFHLGADVCQRDLTSYLNRATELHALPAFAEWLSYFSGTFQLQKLPDGCMPLLTAINSDAESLQRGYLACLVFAISSHNLELARCALGHFSAAEKILAEPLQKIVRKWMATLLRAYGLDMPQGPAAMIKTLLSSPQFNKTGLELLLASPTEYQKIKLSQIPLLLASDIPTALRFIAQVQDKVPEQQMKEWVRRCPQTALLFDTLVRTGNTSWIKLCAENNPQIAWSLYPSTQSQTLLEEVTSRSTDPGLISAWVKQRAPLGAHIAQRLLLICAEHATAPWSPDFIACVKLCRDTLNLKDEPHIVTFLPICLQPQALDHFPEIAVDAFLFLSKKNYPLTRAMRSALLADPTGKCSALKKLDLAKALLIYVRQLLPRYANGTPLPDGVQQAAVWAAAKTAVKTATAATEVAEATPTPLKPPQTARSPRPSKPAPKEAGQSKSVLKSNPTQSINWNDDFERAIFEPSTTARLIRKVLAQPDGGTKELWQLVCEHATPFNMTQSLFLLDEIELLKKYLDKSDLQKLLRLFIPMIAAPMIAVQNRTHELLLKAHAWHHGAGDDLELAFDLLEYSDKDDSEEFYEKQCRLVVVSIQHIKPFLVRAKPAKEKQKAKPIKQQKTYRFSAFVKFLALAKKHPKHVLTADTILLIINMLQGYKHTLIDGELVQKLSTFPSQTIKEAFVQSLPGFLTTSTEPIPVVLDLLEDAPFALQRAIYQAFISNFESTLKTFAQNEADIDAPRLYQSLAKNYGRLLGEYAALADPELCREALAMDLSLLNLPVNLAPLIRKPVTDYFPLTLKLFVAQLGRYSWDKESMAYYNQYVTQQLGPLETPLKRVPSCQELPVVAWEEYAISLTFMESRFSYQGFLTPADVTNPDCKVITIVPGIWKSTPQLLPTEVKYIEVLTAFIRQLVDRVTAIPAESFAEPQKGRNIIAQGAGAPEGRLSPGSRVGIADRVTADRLGQEEKARCLDTIVENLRLLIELYPKTDSIAALLANYVQLVTPKDFFYPIHMNAATALLKLAYRHSHSISSQPAFELALAYLKMNARELTAQNLTSLNELKASIQALLDKPEAPLTEDELFSLQNAFLVWQELCFVDAFEERNSCLMKFFALWEKYPALTANRSVFDTMTTILVPNHRYFGFHHGVRGKEYATQVAKNYLETLCRLNAQELISPHLPVPEVERSNGEEVHKYSDLNLGTLYKRIDIFLESLIIMRESRLFYEEFELFSPFLEEAISLLTTNRKIHINLCQEMTSKLTQILCMPVVTQEHRLKRLALVDGFLRAMAGGSGRLYDKIITLIGCGIVRGRIVLDFTEKHSDQLLQWMGIFDKIKNETLFDNFGKQFLQQAIVIDKMLPEKLLPKAPGRFKYTHSE